MSLPQGLEDLASGYGLMTGENKIGLGILEGKSQPSQLLLGPFPSLYNLVYRLLKISLILQCLRPQRQRQLIHGIGVEGIFHVIQIGDQLLIAYAEANPHSRHRPGLGKGLHHQKIVILFQQGKGSPGAEVHIGLIHYHHHIPIMLQNVLDS